MSQVILETTDRLSYENDVSSYRANIKKKIFKPVHMNSIQGFGYKITKINHNVDLIY